MKKILLIASLFVVTVCQAQTKQYIKVETTKFKSGKMSSMLTKYEGGTVEIDNKLISIDKEAPKPQFYDIARIGAKEAQDEGFYAVEYLCLTLTKSGAMKAAKILCIYSPKNELCDVIIKSKNISTDYCLTEK